MSFASIKTALARILGLGETEAHALVEAAIADLKPLLDDAETRGKTLLATAVADIKAELPALKVDEANLAALIEAAVAKALGKTTPTSGAEPATTTAS